MVVGGGVIEFLSPKKGGCNFIDTNFFVNLGPPPPHSKENDSPLVCNTTDLAWIVSMCLYYHVGAML